MTISLRGVMFSILVSSACFAAADTLSIPTPGTISTTASKAMPMTNTTALKFTNPDHFARIMLIHDTVMGGRSSGNVSQTHDAVLFAGNLSLENNGGFASVEFKLQRSITAGNINQITLHAAADQRTYQLRLKTPFIQQGVAYVAEFTKTSDQHSYQFDVGDFSGRYRGRAVLNLPPLNFSDVSHVSVMLADKSPGPFAITLHSLGFTTN